MVNELHLYCAILTSEQSKSFTILPYNIHPIIKKFTQQHRCQPEQVTASLSGAVRLRCLAQGHLDTLGDLGIELATFRLPANPIYLLSPMPPQRREEGVISVGCNMQSYR